MCVSEITMARLNHANAVRLARMLGTVPGVDAVSGVSGRPNEFYFGAVNGGVWKSIDSGRIWNPVFDSQPVASIGAISSVRPAFSAIPIRS